MKNNTAKNVPMKKVKIINNILRLWIKERRSNHTIPISQIKRILIVDISLIGDEIMNIPMYRTIKENIPDSHVTVVGFPWFPEQLIEQGLIDEIIPFHGLKILESPKAWIKNIRDIAHTISFINKRMYDIAIEPRGDIRYIFFMHFLKAERKISYNLMDTDYMLTDPLKMNNKLIHEIDKRLDILSQIGMKVDENKRYPILKPSNNQAMDNQKFIDKHHLYGKKIIGVHPGASLAVKQYEKYPNVFDELCSLIDKEKYTFLVFGAPNEDSMANAVYKRICKKHFSVKMAKEPLNQYIGRVAVCDYMICNDSGAGHIAAAYGIPVTVIFGPVVSEMYKPRGSEKVYCISHKLDCKPCCKRYCMKGTKECINGITEDEVIKTILNMIEE